MADKYWELERPSEVHVGKFIVKTYELHEKIQFFNWISGASYEGLSKGVTASLDEMSSEEITTLKDSMNKIFDLVLANRKAGKTQQKIKNVRFVRESKRDFIANPDGSDA